MHPKFKCNEQIYNVKSGRWQYCFKLIQRLRVTCFIAGQYNPKLHDTITDLIYTIVGSALLRD